MGSLPQTATNYASTLQERRERVHESARGHMQLMSNRIKQRYDPLLEHQPLEAAEAMWLHNPQRKKGLTPKLQCPWQGPNIITKLINDFSYRIQLGPKAKPKVVHRNWLWRYSGINAPTWYHAHEQEQSTSPAGMTISETPTLLHPSKSKISHLLKLWLLPMNSQLNHSEGVIEADVHPSDMELEPDISCLDPPMLYLRGGECNRIPFYCL